MTINDAYLILGISPGTELYEIKKKYRELMMRVHPDVNVQNKYPYTVQEINTAYSILKREISSDAKAQIPHGMSSGFERKQSSVWNAPVNQHAYTERDILQHVEDYDGTVLGNICIARGKYMWTTDEDFSLFLLSLYQCSKQILDESDTVLKRNEIPMNRQQFQAELTYLLAQQFIAQTTLLQEIAKEEADDAKGNHIFYIPAMLEITVNATSVKAGDTLYPSKIKHHKLYLKNHSAQEIGYLSFTDDRLYYIVVPLFEQKAAQVKIQVSEKQPKRKTKASASYHNLHLWIKLSDSVCTKLPENLNIQIEQLLAKYKLYKEKCNI